MDKDDNNKKNKDQANDRVIDDKLFAADLEYDKTWSSVSNSSFK